MMDFVIFPPLLYFLVNGDGNVIEGDLWVVGGFLLLGKDKCPQCSPFGFVM